VKIKDIRPNEKNPRFITQDALKKLVDSIRRDPEFMRLRPIVVDPAGFILGGNQRYRAIVEMGLSEIPDEWVVSAADLTDEQRRRFILVDNAPEGMAGQWDFELLANEWDVPELEAIGFTQEMLGLAGFGEGDGDLDENPYSRKIEAPIYEITGECPAVQDLVDETKTNELKKEIKRAKLSTEISEFLFKAADRHTVFNFAGIAEYYAHAPADVQALMERSALVIIDFQKAIEGGFITIAEGMLEQAEASKVKNYAN